MSKIVIISCIIAVLCVDFRQAEPLGVPNPLKLLNDLSNQISKGLHDTRVKDNVENSAEDTAKLTEIMRSVDSIQELMNKDTTSLTDLPFSTPACTTLWNDIQGLFNQATSTVNTCVNQGFKQAGVNLQDLVNMGKNIWTTIATFLQSISNCFINSSTSQQQMMPCITGVFSNTQSFGNIPIQMMNISIDMAKIAMFLPEMQTCFLTSVAQQNPQQVAKIMSDLVPCLQSAIPTP